jgi:hypothetical protein
MLHPLVRTDRACPEAAALHKDERLMARGVSPLLSVRACIYRHRPEALLQAIGVLQDAGTQYVQQCCIPLMAHVSISRFQVIEKLQNGAAVKERIGRKAGTAQSILQEHADLGVRL